MIVSKWLLKKKESLPLGKPYPLCLILGLQKQQKPRGSVPSPPLHSLLAKSSIHTCVQGLK
ncbi:rCG22524 [Rattus norvegicus]|uniref:RCG22524 n=1 Tax=Rattus norvegicus TaxID=10116 RepID=A6INE5_RAT|nr:rCG22524 [Rattus norvegicus]